MRQSTDLSNTSRALGQREPIRLKGESSKQIAIIQSDRRIRTPPFVVVATRRISFLGRPWWFVLGPSHVATKGRTNTNPMISIVLRGNETEEGFRRGSLGAVIRGIKKQKTLWTFLGLQFPTCRAPHKHAPREPCAGGNLLDSKLNPAISVAPRYFPDVQKPLEILSSPVCLSVRRFFRTFIHSPKKLRLVAFPSPVLSEPQMRLEQTGQL